MEPTERVLLVPGVTADGRCVYCSGQVYGYLDQSINAAPDYTLRCSSCRVVFDSAHESHTKGLLDWYKAQRVGGDGDG